VSTVSGAVLRDRHRPRGGTIQSAACTGADGRPDADVSLFDKHDPGADGAGQRVELVPAILPLLTDEDPLGVDGFATHTLPWLRRAGVRMFQKKSDGPSRSYSSRRSDTLQPDRARNSGSE